MKTELKKSGKLARSLRKPYIKNRISFTSELYPNDTTARSLVTAGASGSFNIRLFPLIAWVAAAAGALWLVSTFRSRK